MAFVEIGQGYRHFEEIFTNSFSIGPGNDGEMRTSLGHFPPDTIVPLKRSNILHIPL